MLSYRLSETWKGQVTSNFSSIVDFFFLKTLDGEAKRQWKSLNAFYQSLQQLQNI